MSHSVLVSFGYFSIIPHLLAFISISTSKMLKLNIVSTLLLGFSMMAFEGHNGFLISFISVILKFTALLGICTNIKEWHKTIIGLIFGASYFILFNNEGWFGILPSISMIFVVFADFQKNILTMKYYYYGSAFCWLIYGIFLQSNAAILYDLIGISALTFSLINIKKQTTIGSK